MDIPEDTHPIEDLIRDIEDLWEVARRLDGVQAEVATAILRALADLLRSGLQ